MRAIATITSGLLLTLLVSAAPAQEFTGNRPPPQPQATVFDGAAAPRVPVPLSSPKTGENSPLRVTPPSRNNAAQPPRAASGLPSLVTMMASLAIVLGIFFLVAWCMRRGLPAGAQLLPTDVVEVLGRTPLAGRQYAHLVRCGNKLLLVSISPGVAETLTEITDPVEVDRLSGLCRQAQATSASASFKQIFQQFGRERPGRGFAGDNRAQVELANSKSSGTPAEEDADDL